jgi:hypothetical protein
LGETVPAKIPALSGTELFVDLDTRAALDTIGLGRLHQTHQIPGIRVLA